MRGAWFLRFGRASLPFRGKELRTGDGPPEYLYSIFEGNVRACTFWIFGSVYLTLKRKNYEIEKLLRQDKARRFLLRLLSLRLAAR